MFWKGRAAKWTRPAACGGARDMELARTLPEGRSVYGKCNGNTHNGTTCFSARKRYFASCASFLHTFFWQDRNGTKQQTSEAFAVWRGRATEWTSFRACAEARDMEFVRTSRRSDSCGLTAKMEPPVNPEKASCVLRSQFPPRLRRGFAPSGRKRALSPFRGDEKHRLSAVLYSPAI